MRCPPHHLRADNDKYLFNRQSKSFIKHRLKFENIRNKSKFQKVQAIKKMNLCSSYYGRKL